MSLSEADFFGNRLRELRENKGLTQKQLAEGSGVETNSIARLERGEREPSWRTLLSLCKALGVDCTAFTTPPTTIRPAGPGRPAKAKPGATEGKPKRSRGRPRKDQSGETKTRL